MGAAGRGRNERAGRRTERTAALGYKYPAFLSYRWNPDFDNFFALVHTLLQAHLRQHLSGLFHPCDLFRDVESQGAGAVLPIHVGTALARSAVLVPLLAPSYYGPASPYTSAELDHMMRRRALTEAAHPLVLPLLITDGDFSDLPPDASALIQTTITRFLDNNLRPGSAPYRELGNELGRLALQIAAAVRAAPRYDDSWSADATARLEEAWRIRKGLSRPQQRDLIRL